MDDYEDFPLPPQLGWMGDQPLLLASASQTRMAMLIDAGLPIMVAPSDIDESVIKQRVRSEGGRQPGRCRAGRSQGCNRLPCASRTDHCGR